MRSQSGSIRTTLVTLVALSVVGFLAAMFGLQSATTCRMSCPPPVAPASPSTTPSPVDEAMASMSVGTTMMLAPEEAILGEPFEVRLAIAPRGDLTNVSVGTWGELAWKSSQARMSPLMEATLTGQGFLVQPTSPTRQAVPSMEGAEWAWQATPTDTGTHRLELYLSAVLDVHGKEAPLVVQTMHRDVEVSVTAGMATKGFVKENWQWLCTTLLIPFGVWAWTSRRRKRR